MLSNGHAGFGERPEETDRWQHRYRASGRLNRLGAAGLTALLAVPIDVHADGRCSGGGMEVLAFAHTPSVNQGQYSPPRSVGMV